jgi:rare lipoprotein A
MRATVITMVSALIALSARPAAAQTFDERWSIIPKAHAEQNPKPDDQSTPTPVAPAQSGKSSDDHSARSFWGKASFYSYRRGKTASGSAFDRDLPTAAHRSLPFGTKVRVTNLANHKSVVVVINDRGPQVHGRVLDLSLAAARSLGMTDRSGVAIVRGEVL